jgi:uncharacterized protein
MKEFVEGLVRNLVDQPEQIRVDVHETSNSATFTLSVAAQDIGKVIGKKGKTAQAMRTLISAVAARRNKRAILEIVDHVNGTGPAEHTQ